MSASFETGITVIGLLKALSRNPLGSQNESTGESEQMMIIEKLEMGGSDTGNCTILVTGIFTVFHQN